MTEQLDPWEIYVNTPASLSIAVCGHYKRARQARQLADNVGGHLVLDEGTAGELANHDRAWLRAWETAEASHRPRWCVVLEDDAVIPKSGFTGLLAELLGTVPERIDGAGLRGRVTTDWIVSLYLGRERPPEWQDRIEQALGVAEDLHATWIRARRLLWGVSVAIPTALVPSMLAYVGRLKAYKPYDERLSDWARTAKLPVLYSCPSLVDHDDGPPVIEHRADGVPRDRPRTAWSTGTPRLGGPIVDL